VPTPPPAMKPYAVFDVGAGAKFKAFDRDYNVSLTVKNVADKKYLVHRFNYANPREFTFSFSGKF
jgi:outer membrane receptor protein involved in Fe transport